MADLSQTFRTVRWVITWARKGDGFFLMKNLVWDEWKIPIYINLPRKSQKSILRWLYHPFSALTWVRFVGVTASMTQLQNLSGSKVRARAGEVCVFATQNWVNHGCWVVSWLTMRYLCTYELCIYIYIYIYVCVYVKYICACIYIYIYTYKHIDR